MLFELIPFWNGKKLDLQLRNSKSFKKFRNALLKLQTEF